VAEYAPNAVKKAVVGVGHADKRQIDHMVRMQLAGRETGGPDAADALAMALCHAFHAQAAACARARRSGAAHDRQADRGGSTTRGPITC
jgi:crossover junction endodeoxyribonuclease RuvC